MRRLIVTLAALLAMVTAAQAQGPSTRPTTRPLKLTILDPSDKPVAGATVKLEGVKGSSSSGDDGVVQVSIDPAADNVYLRIKADGFVPKRLIWSKYGEPQNQPDKVPSEMTLRLAPGVPIGGKVTDDAGRPIDGATVVLHVWDQSSRRAVESYDLSYTTVTTAADGTWTFAAAPETFERINVGVRHPEYLAGRDNHGYFPMDEVKDHALLRNRAHTSTLERGVIIEGTVFGVDGKPLPKAGIGLGRDRVASNVLPEVKTDDNGKYRIAVDGAAPAVLTVRAKGHSPVAKTVTAGKGMTLDFNLVAAQTIRGRVVDPEGKPVAGAWVFFDEWQGFRTISHRTQTNQDGLFTWNEAPADRVKADVEMIGFARERDVWLMPSKDDSDITTIKIKRPLKVTGTVVDAETGEPVKAFKIVTGIWWSDQQAISWQRRGEEGKKGSDGKFDLKLTWPYPGHAVRIEADGYLPGESRVFKMDEGTVALEIKLTKGEGIKGTVRDANGKPAKAKLVVATPSATAYLRNGEELLDQGCQSCDVGNDGAYSLPAQTGAWTIVAFGDAGYAEVTPEQFAKSADITLQPWGRIEGVAMVGSKPAAGADLAVYDNQQSGDRNAPRIFHQQEAKADLDGKFRFTRIRPGDVSVARLVRQGMMTSYANTTKVTVKPGETAEVTVGGKGRPIVGRVQLPPEIAGREDWEYGFSSMRTKVEFPKPKTPDDVNAMDPEKRQAWHQEWQKSDEGKAYLAAFRKAQEQMRSYPVLIDPTGAFRIDDVDAGTYTLDIHVAQRPKERICGFGDTLATGSLAVTVPEMPGGRSDEVLDVGTVEVKALKHVNVGDVAPAMSGKLLDGKDFTLESLKGKYVVLDFWATWCGPCIAELPALKSAYEAFAANEKFAMVSISLDEEAATARTFAEKQGMTWTQIHLPGVWEHPAVKDYGVRGIPSVWLIGPDGKVLAKDLRGETLKQALEQHLAK